MNITTLTPVGAEGLRRHASGIRRRALETVVRRKSGYLAQACSSAEIFAALYGHVLDLGPSDFVHASLDTPTNPAKGSPADSISGRRFNGPKTAEFDRLIISPAHYALVVYCALVEFGRLHEDSLRRYAEDGSALEAVGAEFSPGMEFMGGSLGQGLSQGAGIAMGRKLNGDTGRVFVFTSDGELQEGQTWEAIQAAKFHSLGNLTVIVDVNGQQVDGRTTDVMDVNPVDERFRAFGVGVHRVDGHNVSALVSALHDADKHVPTVVVCSTDPKRNMPPLEPVEPRSLHALRLLNDSDLRPFELELEFQNRRKVED